MKVSGIRLLPLLLLGVPPLAAAPAGLTLHPRGYFELPGLNVMNGSDYYPDGHQGGVGIIQHGLRTATNGDLRLEPTPGQWQPMPKAGERVVDTQAGEIRVHLSYPDDTKNRRGFNPIDYPDLALGYTVRLTPAGGTSFRIRVDLDGPLPAAWAGRVGFNLELFPGLLFGKSYQLGDQRGTFPRDPVGPGGTDPASHTFQVAPLAAGGRRLLVAPESEEQRLVIESVTGGPLQLLDGRAEHNNGWFVVRALVDPARTHGAVEWLVTPHAIPGWRARPVVQVSQVGYHPAQPKVAVLELDPRDDPAPAATLWRLGEQGDLAPVAVPPAQPWGDFLRSRYARLDFSGVTQPGTYVIRCGTTQSSPFVISPTAYQRGVWQPTVQTFLPVQMCHLRVEDRYRVWHGLCHVDDALMAPVNHNHFDGYAQGPSTLTSFQPGDHVPGLDVGGWHDAGDYDLRVDSQADTVHGLALAWELFHPADDLTTIDQGRRVAQLFRPDGQPDLLQQIEHGVRALVSSHRALGRLYRGVQDATLHQYTHLGDAATVTDGQVFRDDGRRTAQQAQARAAQLGRQDDPTPAGLPPLGTAGAADDRWVFTEDNPDRELGAAAALAAAARALRGHDDALADECRRIALELWDRAGTPRFPLSRLAAAIDLLQTTGEARFATAITDLGDFTAQNLNPSQGGENAPLVRGAWLAARALPLVKDTAYREKIRTALQAYRTRVDALAHETPYGLPYRPDIWGAGWSIQRFGVEQYFLHRAAPDLFPADYLYNALNFILGCHPGPNPASFVSGVGARSVTVAYGVNRADWSYIPGGIVSGTALIRPDFPELLEWPYLWQQTEYCVGRPTSDYVLLVLAVNDLLNQP